MTRLFVKPLLALMLWALAPELAVGQAHTQAMKPTEIKRLGGANAFRKGKLESPAQLLTVMQEHRGDFESILAQAGWRGSFSHLTEAVAAGNVEEIMFPVGGRLHWMALRKKGAPQIARDIVWAGKKPFEAYRVSFTADRVTHTFVVPKVCSNLALLDSVPLPPPPKPVARVSATPASECISREVRIDASKSSVSEGRIVSLEVSIKRPDGGTDKLPTAASNMWTRSYDAPGSYTVTAVAVTDEGQRGQASTTFKRVACPPSCALALSDSELWQGEPFSIDASRSKAQVGSVSRVLISISDEQGNVVSEMALSAPFQTDTQLDEAGTYTVRAVADDSFGQRSENTCEASIFMKPRFAWLADAFAGTERRWREGYPTDRSAPLVGAKFGPSYRVHPQIELAAGLGAAFNTRDNDNSSLFGDVEVNFFGKVGMVGLGVGFWDVTHEETRTGSFLVHAGLNLPWEIDIHPVMWLFEARMFFDHADHLDNNYAGWTGLRFHY